MKKEHKAFGIYSVGDIVVSLGSKTSIHNNRNRPEGSMWEVLSCYDTNRLKYKFDASSVATSEWRAATAEEIAAYHQGVRHTRDVNYRTKIDDIQDKIATMTENEKVAYLLTLK